MSMTIVTSEGTPLTGDTALDIVRQMNARALIGEADAWRYMVVFAGRFRQLRGHQIRSGSPEQFLEDLAKVGFITLEDPSPAPSPAEVPPASPSDAPDGDR